MFRMNDDTLVKVSRQEKKLAIPSPTGTVRVSKKRPI
jgi:hypothetical protein